MSRPSKEEIMRIFVIIISKAIRAKKMIEAITDILIVRS